MEPATLLPYLSLFVSASTAGGLLYNWFSASGARALKELAEHKKTLAAAIDAINDRQQKAEARLQTVEGELRHLPNREQTHRIELQLAHVSGRIDVIAKEIEPLASIADRWQELILEQAKK